MVVVLDAAAPPVVVLPGGIAALSAGESQTCALTGAGGVLCWGGYRHQDPITGEIYGFSTTPAPVDALPGGVARQRTHLVLRCPKADDVHFFSVLFLGQFIADNHDEPTIGIVSQTQLSNPKYRLQQLR